MISSVYYLGFDFGMRCIGVAIGQTASCHASPLAILKAKQGVPTHWAELDKLCKEWIVKGFVVGLAEGKEVPQHFQSATKKFAKALQDRYQLPCYFVDEHYSTLEAKHSTQFKPTQNNRHDDVAAAVILQQYLTTQQVED